MQTIRSDFSWQFVSLNRVFLRIHVSQLSKQGCIPFLHPAQRLLIFIVSCQPLCAATLSVCCSISGSIATCPPRSVIPSASLWWCLCDSRTFLLGPPRIRCRPSGFLKSFFGRFPAPRSPCLPGVHTQLEVKTFLSFMERKREMDVKTWGWNFPPGVGSERGSGVGWCGPAVLALFSG